MVFLNNCII